MKNSKKIILTLILMLALILACLGNLYATNDETQQTNTTNNIGVTYQTHIQDVGWQQGWKTDGDMAGTYGKSLRLEGIKIKLNNAPGIKIKYQTHIQDVGWQQGWMSDGDMAGTYGRSLRLEGIKIELENTNEYSVMYRVHIQDIGWQQGWVADGELAGTYGKGLRLEGIEIKIVPKIAKGKITVESNVPSKIYEDTTINISGWKMANVSNNFKVTLDGTQISSVTYLERAEVIQNNSKYGTIVENPKPGFEISINTAGMSEGEHTIKLELLKTDDTVIQEYTKKIAIDRGMHVKYYVHAENIGWQSDRIDGETAGSVGLNQRIEAISITGINVPSGVSIQYNAHVQNIGWQGWMADGDIAGTSGKSYRLEAIRMKITGTDQYSIQYRAYVQGVGWQNWCYDGEAAGTILSARKIEAIQIQIVPKINKEMGTVCIDTPLGSTTNEVNNITGWAMATVPNVTFKIFINGHEINSSALQRTARQDVLNGLKGYGDDQVNNQNPGFSLPVDFSQYPLGQISINVRICSGDKILDEVGRIVTIRQKIYYGTGVYGVSGLKSRGDPNGSDLQYYQYGSGPNVLFATFALHGFEDLWAKDGLELVQIANDFYQRLINLQDVNIANKWTIYIFPGVNMDGLNHGYTNNGPGRTTLYSQAPGTKGIDLNRCWAFPKVDYTDRNYTGTAQWQACEALYLRNFLLSHKSQNGQTLLVDLHGWMKQVIGDPTICSYYSAQYPGLYQGSVGRYGTGFLINWARSNLGSTTRACKSALIELPNEVYGHQSVLNAGFSEKYIAATLNMLRTMNV